MNNFDWKTSHLGEGAQSCDIRHDEKRYWFAVSRTLRDTEWQAMCNGVRIVKTFFDTPQAAKAECERWFEGEVLKGG